MILTGNNPYKYETENVCRLFFPETSFNWLADEDISGEISSENDSEIISVDFIKKDTLTKVIVRAKINDFIKEKTEDISPDEKEYKSECEWALARLVYALLSEYTGFYPKWGILTGVRPAKLYEKYNEKYGIYGAFERFTKNLLVSPEKTRLAEQTLVADRMAREINRKNSYSLYVSVPFCPTRCSYCSFVSHSVEHTEKLVEPFTELLCKELENTFEIADSLGLCLETIYFGGGTPTQLSAKQLDRVMNVIEKNVNITGIREYTVEAGRPDTVTPEKLAVLKNHGVSRISINPQTLEDEVLKNIGRRHTVAQFYEAFKMASDAGFDNINTDLIAGLPGQTVKSFTETVKGILDLSPANITIHTLSVKRSSRIATEKEAVYNAHDTDVDKMLSVSAGLLYENGYAPYYLYRQSKMRGNLENTGWCKPERECLYNIFMMNEIHTVLSAGAGAVTRLKSPDGDEIERIFNFKYPYEYISRFEEMLIRKKKVSEFYDKYAK